MLVETVCMGPMGEEETLDSGCWRPCLQIANACVTISLIPAAENVLCLLMSWFLHRKVRYTTADFILNCHEWMERVFDTVDRCSVVSVSCPKRALPV